MRLSNNVVLDVNKEKEIEKFVGQLVEVSGELKVKDGEVKLDSVKAIEASAIPAGDPARNLLDVRTYKAPGAPKIYEKIRHELAMMPYIREFDFISFAMVGDSTARGYFSGANGDSCNSGLGCSGELYGCSHGGNAVSRTLRRRS